MNNKNRLLLSVAAFSFIISLGFSQFLLARTLSESAALALIESPLVNSTKLELNIQNLREKEVAAAYYPRVSLGLGLGREDSNNSTTRLRLGEGSEELERREASISLRQIVFDGYDTLWTQFAEEAQYSVLELELELAAQEVVSKAIVAHIEVVTANAIEALNSDNWWAHKNIARQIEKRVDIGRDDEADVSQVRARLSLAEANLEQAKGVHVAARARYFEVAGSEFDESSSDALVLGETSDIASHNEFESLVMEHNIELKVAQAGIVVSRYAAQAAKSSSWPTVSIDAGASWNANIDGVKGRNSDAFAMLRLDYDLYAGGSRKAAQKRKFLEVEQNQARIDEVTRWLKREIDVLWDEMQRSQTRLKLLGDYVLAARKTKEAYKKQFEIGRRSLIELLDAENELAISRREFTVARSDELKTRLRVLSLQGKLLSSLELEPN